MSLYDVLGVDRGATRGEIRTAYRRLVQEHHPDKGGDPARFREIQAAWEILGDHAKRDAYDLDGCAEAAAEGMTKIESELLRSFVVLLANMTAQERPYIPDMVELMRQRVREVMNDKRKDIRSEQARLERLQRIEKRISRRSGKRNIFRDAIASQIDMAKSNIEAGKKDVIEGEEMFDYLADYQWSEPEEVDRLRRAIASKQRDGAFTVRLS